MTDTVLQVLETTTLPTSPDDIQVTADHPTAAELEDYLATWLNQAEQDGKIADLALLGRTLAEPGEPYKYSKRTPPRRFQVGEVCLHYTPSHYITSTHTTIHGEFERLVVTIGGQPPFELVDGRQVVNIFRGKAESGYGQADVAKQMADNFYLPGEWEEILLSRQKQAVHKINQIQTEKDQVRRQELLARIGLVHAE